jgi:hypothetical protein
MSGGTPAGRLSIEIVAEIARLQADMDRCKRLVAAASGDIARSAKAANDNLAGMGRGASAGLKQVGQEAQRTNEFLRDLARSSTDVATRINAMTGVSGGMRRSAEDIAAYGRELDRLRAIYNPLFAVTQQYRASLEGIRKAHAVGAISAEEMAEAISRERQATLGSIAEIKGRTAAAKAAADAEADYVKSIEDLQKQANPAGAAQAHLNAQMALAEKAFREGRLAADDYAQIIHNLQTRMNLLNTDGFGPLGAGGRVAGHHMLNLSFQMQDLGIQMLGAAQSSAPLKLAFTALAQQGSQIYGVIQQSGLGIKAFAVEALVAAKIIKVSGDEALIAAARQAAAHEAVVASLAERALANVATAEAEVALARAQVGNASTATEAAAAHSRLARAESASGAAAAESATAQAALARAQAASAAATGAAAASQTTMLTAASAAAAGVFTVLGVAAGGALVAMKNFKKEVEDSGELNRYRASLGLTHKEMLQLSDGVDKVGGKIKKLSDITVTNGDIMAGLWKTISDGADVSGPWISLKNGASSAFSAILDAWLVTSAGITASIYGTFNIVKTVWTSFPAVFGDLFVQGVNAAIGALNKLVKAGVDQLNGFIAAANKLPFTNLSEVSAPQIDLLTNANAGAAVKAGQEIAGAYSKAYAQARKDDAVFWKQVRANAKQSAKDRMAGEAAALKANRTPKTDKAGESLARELEATEALIAGLYRSAAAYDVSTAAGQRARVEAEAIAKGIKKQADVQSYATLQLRKYVAEQVNGAAEQVAAMRDQTRAQEFVNQAIRNGTLEADKASDALADMAEQQKLMTAMSIASMNGDKLGYDKAKAALAGLTKAQLDNKKARLDTADLQLAAQIDKSIKDTELETRLTKDLGAARLAALRGLSGDALEDELARIAAQHEKIAIQMHAEADAAREVALGHTEAAAAVMRKAEADKTQVDARFEIEKQTVAIDRYNDHLRDTISLLGKMGKVGKGFSALLGIVTGNTKQIGGSIGNLLNIGIGFKTDDTGEQIAQTIGDKLTEVFSRSGAIGRTLGSLAEGAGPFAAAVEINKMIGSVFGFKGGPLGIFQGLFDSLIGKVKWGRVDLSAAGVSGTSGNSGSSEKAALAAGNSIFGSLTDLASQFGGAIGNFGNISVGVRHGDYRVNAGGTSLKVKKGAVDFNDDAEAAVAYAMKLAIERGAITGIRASTNNLLKAGDDLSAQITKAVSFEGVFSDLKGYLDPVGAELDTIDKEFANLRTIFAEAGASAAEYAQLEQLLSIKRQEAMDKEQDALDDIRSRIAEAQGDDATVTAIARAKELKDATSDAQRALLQQLYAIEDATAAQDKLTEAQDAATAAADQLRQAWASIGTDLMDEVNRIRGLTGGSDAISFAALQGQFNAAVTAARGGDQAAAGKLAELSQSLLDVAGNTATSRQELERIKAQTAATLEGVYNAIQKMDVSATSTATAAEATAATSSSTSSAEATATNDLAAEVRSLRTEMAQMRADMNSGNATIAGNTGRMAKKLDDVTPTGNAIAVTGTK